jgi:hypothetical protein
MQIYIRSTTFATYIQYKFILFNNTLNCYRYMASNEKTGE